MKINLETTFKNLEGGFILNSDGKFLILRHVIAVSLSMARCSMEPTKAWKIAQEVMGVEGEEFEVPTEVAAQVKEAISSHNWVPMVIAQAHNAIEGVS